MKSLFDMINILKRWIYRDERGEIHAVIDRVEGHYKEVKTDLESIQHRIDPLKDMLLDMGRTFNSNRDHHNVGE